MQKLSVLTARAVAFIEISELNQHGSLHFPDIATALVERFGFIRYPRVAEDFDLEKGIEFSDGTRGGISIKRFAVFGGIMILETQVSTETSKQILLEVLLWLRDQFRATFVEKQVRRWVYLNQFLFKTDFPILAEFSGPLATLASKTNAAVSEIFGEDMGYQSQAIQIGHDPVARKNGIAALQIFNRGGIPYAENRYFSEAPLSTDVHWKLLEDFERDVLEDRKARR